MMDSSQLFLNPTPYSWTAEEKEDVRYLCINL